MNTKWLVTWFYAGLLPGAPGTWGSLAALPFAYILHWQGGPIALMLATIILCIIGLWATQQYLGDTGGKDPSEVVIDEVVGQMIALWPLSLGLAYIGHASHLVPWPGWVGAFILFRFFDILKPWPIKKLEQLKGAFGVMADDVVAGVFSAILLVVTAVIGHGIFI